MKGKLARAKFVLWFNCVRIHRYVAVPQKSVVSSTTPTYNALYQDQSKMEYRPGWFLTFHGMGPLWWVWGKRETHCSKPGRYSTVHPQLTPFQSHPMPISLSTVPRIPAWCSIYILVWMRSIREARVSDCHCKCCKSWDSIPASLDTVEY